ncbi:3TM-type holin [Methylorubrum populi]
MAAGILGTIAAAVLPDIMPTIGKILDRVIPDPVESQKVQLQIAQALANRDQAFAEMLAKQNEQQAAINLAEAQSPSLWTSGWRPALAWTLVFGFAYSFVLAPMVAWLAAILGTALGIAFPTPPTLDTESLMTMLLGMLGLSGLKTAERIGGVDPNVGLKLPRC